MVYKIMVSVIAGMPPGVAEHYGTACGGRTIKTARYTIIDRNSTTPLGATRTHTETETHTGNERHIETETCAKTESGQVLEYTVRPLFPGTFPVTDTLIKIVITSVISQQHLADKDIIYKHS